jgi:hypothetical protein
MKHMVTRRRLIVGSSAVVALAAYVAITAFLRPSIRDPLDHVTSRLSERK